MTENRAFRGGFTLIELLLTIAIIGVIAGIIIIAIAPRKSFIAARDAERRHMAKELSSALYQHLIDEWELAGGGMILDGESNAKPICKEGVPDNACAEFGGVSLSMLPPEYIAELPEDVVMPKSSQCTGYMVYQSAGRPHVFAANLGKLAGDPAAGSCGGCAFVPLSASCDDPGTVASVTNDAELLDYLADYGADDMAPIGQTKSLKVAYNVDLDAPALSSLGGGVTTPCSLTIDAAVTTIAGTDVCMQGDLSTDFFTPTVNVTTESISLYSPNGGAIGRFQSLTTTDDVMIRGKSTAAITALEGVTAGGNVLLESTSANAVLAMGTPITVGGNFDFIGETGARFMRNDIIVNGNLTMKVGANSPAIISIPLTAPNVQVGGDFVVTGGSFNTLQDLNVGGDISITASNGNVELSTNGNYAAANMTLTASDDIIILPMATYTIGTNADLNAADTADIRWDASMTAGNSINIDAATCTFGAGTIFTAPAKTGTCAPF